MKKLLVLASIFAMSACATMFNGTTKNINVMTSNGDRVKADITSKSGMQTVTLPSIISVDKGNVAITISVKEDKCHRQTVYMADNHLDMFFLANAFNYFTGTSTDIPNGAMWTYDDNIVVPVYRKESCETK
ncbi:MAG: hypothetical protein SO314_06800 [Alphaproteobacteria bacterium]|nr:hypothetical protein [Alphaproteobacteria bacterium]